MFCPHNNGSGATNIGNEVFYSCTNLTGVYFKGNAPSFGANVFYGDNSATVYYLPGTTGWSLWFDCRPPVLWKPQVQPSGASFGVGTNRFGFNITGTNGLAVVVEACTNLANLTWSPLQTNNLTGGPVYFWEPCWTNYTRRFYVLGVPRRAEAAGEEAVETKNSDKEVSREDDGHIYNVFLRFRNGHDTEPALREIENREKAFLRTAGPASKPLLLAAGPCLPHPKREPEWSAFLTRVNPVCFYLEKSHRRCSMACWSAGTAICNVRSAHRTEVSAAGIRTSRQSIVMTGGSWFPGIEPWRTSAGRWQAWLRYMRS